MLKSNQAFSSFSVDDVSKAKDFYGQKLGVEVTEQDGMLQLTIANGGHVLVYPQSNHVAASFTILNIPVDDIRQVVDELVVRGLRFEHYSGGADGVTTDEKGIFTAEEMGVKQAWIKDPAGNIVSIIETT